MPLFDKFMPQRYNFFEYYADFLDIFPFTSPPFILSSASFYFHHFHHFLHLPNQQKIVSKQIPNAIRLLKSYPSAMVCRTRGVRFIVVEGYGVQHQHLYPFGQVICISLYFLPAYTYLLKSHSFVFSVGSRSTP